MVALALLAGCMPEPQPCGPTLTVQIAAFGELDVEEGARRAAAYWTMMGCPVEVMQEGAEIAVRWDDGLLPERLGRLVGGVTTDFYDVALAPHDFYSSDDCSTASLTTLLAHEIGHVFGYGHSPNPDAVMGKIAAWCDDKTSPPAPIF